MESGGVAECADAETGGDEALAVGIWQRREDVFGSQYRCARYVNAKRRQE